MKHWTAGSNANEWEELERRDLVTRQGALVGWVGG